MAATKGSRCVLVHCSSAWYLCWLSASRWEGRGAFTGWLWYLKALPAKQCSTAGNQCAHTQGSALDLHLVMAGTCITSPAITRVAFLRWQTGRPSMHRCCHWHQQVHSNVLSREAGSCLPCLQRGQERPFMPPAVMDGIGLGSHQPTGCSPRSLINASVCTSAAASMSPSVLTWVPTARLHTRMRHERNPWL